MNPLDLIGLAADLIEILGLAWLVWTFFKKEKFELVRFGLILPSLKKI
jgi:hypothetical protein